MNSLPPRSEISTATARSDRVRRSIDCDLTFVSLAGDLDLVLGYRTWVLGEYDGELTFIANTRLSTEPALLQRTGSANPFDPMEDGWNSAPALGDIDGDGTLRPRPSID